MVPEGSVGGMGDQHQGLLTVLIGADDETWDIAVELPKSTVRQILDLLD